MSKLTRIFPLLAVATCAVFAAALLSSSNMAQAQSASPNGARLFAQCAACHSLKPGVRSGVGPNLTGMFGKKAGTVAADFKYSPAMSASTIRWNDKTLDNFLTDPKKAVPGTKMIFRGIAKPADRAALIAHLKTNTRSAK
jgi:cytochrome c